MLFRGLAGIAIVVLVSCTKPNPRSCLDGSCTDPAFPFCDVNGTLGGIENECIAVSCTTGEFAECRENVAVTCNADGTNFDLTRCERVCDGTSGGCRLCEANETACTNGVLATCDSAGNVAANNVCALGCFDGTRCKAVVASNGLDQYRDMVPDPGDLDLSGTVVIDTVTGSINGVSSVPSFLRVAPADGAAVRVFIAHDVRIGNVTVRGGTSGLQPALAIVATGAITVEGSLAFTTETPSAGGVDFAECRGGFPNGGIIPPGNEAIFSGGGGAGFGTAGAKGGDISNVPGQCVNSPDGTCAGGVAGGISGSETLIPLRGGCSSNGPVGGGGALQLSSDVGIRVIGTIDVNGAGGRVISEVDPQTQVTVYSILGGSSGGGILLEAPSVELASGAKMLANGGSGSSRSGNGYVSPIEAPISGASCDAPGPCGSGGSSGTATIPAGYGMSVVYNGSLVTSTGGGGAGVGRIRINTADGTYAKGAGVSEAGVLTTGTIQSR